MLDHHKRNKNIISNRKAFSSIVGAIFAILVIVSLAGTFFVWSLQQNSRYVNAVSEINQLAIDRQSESLNVTDAPAYTVGGSGVSTTPVAVSVSVQNDGPIYVNVTALWIAEIDSESYGYVPYSHVILPGETWPITDTVFINAASSSGPYYGWLITARGNVVPLYPAHAKGYQGVNGTIGLNGADGDPGANGSTWIVRGRDPLPGDGVTGDFFLNTVTGDVYQMTSSGWGAPIGNLKGQTGPIGPEGPAGTTRSSQTAQGIGSIMLDFKSFRAYPVAMYNKQYYTGVINLNTNSSTYSVSNSIPYVFSVNVTNVDMTNKSIILRSSSSFWMTNPPPNNGPLTCANWMICNLTGTGTTKQVRNLAANEFIELPWDVPTTLYFGPMLPTTGALATGTAAATNMLLIGSILTQPIAIDYGQNLPFIALNVVA